MKLLHGWIFDCSIPRQETNIRVEYVTVQDQRLKLDCTTSTKWRQLLENALLSVSSLSLFESKFIIPALFRARSPSYILPQIGHTILICSLSAFSITNSFMLFSSLYQLSSSFLLFVLRLISVVCCYLLLLSGDVEINPGPGIADVVNCVCSVGSDQGDLCYNVRPVPVGPTAPALRSPSPLHKHIHLSVLSV